MDRQRCLEASRAERALWERPSPISASTGLFSSFTHSNLQPNTHLSLPRINDAFSGLCILWAWKILSPPPLTKGFPLSSGFSSETSGSLQENFPRLSSDPTYTTSYFPTHHQSRWTVKASLTIFLLDYKLHTDKTSGSCSLSICWMNEWSLHSL